MLDDIPWKRDKTIENNNYGPWEIQKGPTIIQSNNLGTTLNFLR